MELAASQVTAATAKVILRFAPWIGSSSGNSHILLISCSLVEIPYMLICDIVIASLTYHLVLGTSVGHNLEF